MADNRPPIQVYIENAADSTIGGFTIPLPTTKETLAPWLAAIEVDGSNPNGTDIKEIKSSEMLMRALRHRNHHLEELNYLAARIKGMNPSDTDMFMAVLETGRFDGDITKIINLTENLGRYDLQPAFIAEQYGDFLIDNAKDETADALGRLEKSDNSDDRVLAAHILRLESYIDAAAYGRGMAELEDGVFTQHGYLIEVAGDPHEVYRGPEDIPREYRLFNEPGPLAVRDVDLAPFLLKLHALAGDYGRNVSHNLETLSRLRSTDYLLLLDGKSAYLTEAAHAYRRGTTAFDIWMRAGGETEQAFAIHLTEVHSRLAGDVYQIDVTERQKDLINHSVQPVRIDASLKNGGTQSYLPDEWSALPLVERDRVQDWVRVFRDEDHTNIHRHIDNITAGFEENGKTIDGDTLLSNVNAAYMEESRYPDYGYLRVTQYAAKEMLARGDADVYRLLPHEMEKLSTMDAVKSGLWFAEHREFAIKREDMPGLDKWAERSAGDIMSRSQERGEHKKLMSRSYDSGFSIGGYHMTQIDHKFEGQAVIRGDTLRVLQTFPDSLFGGIVTDPPYASGASDQNARQKSTAMKYSSVKTGNPLPDFEGDSKDQRSCTHWMTEWLIEARRVTKPARPSVCSSTGGSCPT